MIYRTLRPLLCYRAGRCNETIEVAENAYVVGDEDCDYFGEPFLTHVALYNGGKRPEWYADARAIYHFARLSPLEQLAMQAAD